VAGLYIHIPFCKKACIYCDFHFSTSLKYKQEMVDAICKELKMRKEFLNNKPLKSIYFGGGTPSLMEKNDLDQIFDAIHHNFSVDTEAEITLEANPDDLTTDKLKSLSASLINRLSIGVQSFRDEDLILMNRSHNSQQAEKCISQAQDLGLENISIDLIYAQPNMSNRVWKEQLQKAISLNVNHISSYALTVEPKTVLAYKIKTGEIKELNDETAFDQFSILVDELSQAGYDHYEVSNFSKNGRRAVHNSSYWKGDPYLGVGPSAHSFCPGLRSWNISNNALYLKGIESGEMAMESENLSLQDQFNEWLMISLRTMEGLDRNVLELQFQDFKNHFQTELIPLLSLGKLEENGDRIFIPRAWRFHSDGIASSLFYI
tara:strand:+ start:126007 stop:127131 length:1125 start_codon:yes stop_codon:yes gene_type:complete